MLLTVMMMIMIMTVSNVVVYAQKRTPVDDSIEVSLLTCAPGQKVYSLYGHTAIRYHDKRTGDDWAFNYGVFNAKKPHFVLRFVFGLTDYELGVVPTDVFQQEYHREGREVTEQVLNMTTDEKLALLAALDENYRPENRVYRYNYFYDNCTTRARDMIERTMNGRLRYAVGKDAEDLSYRDMIHGYTESHPWAACGNDLCLGLKSDLNTDWRERQFLPQELMRDMSKATVKDADGNDYPVVLATRTLVDGGMTVVGSEFPLSPLGCSFVFLAIVLAVTVAEVTSGRRWWARVFDVALMTVQGIAGIIVLSLFFSEHPTTSTNLQLLVLNPLPLFFVYKVARGRHTCYWKLSILATALFFLGFFVQDYAEGMVVVALSLLVRGAMNEYRQRKRINNKGTHVHY